MMDRPITCWQLLSRQRVMPVDPVLAIRSSDEPAGGIFSEGMELRDDRHSEAMTHPIDEKDRTGG